MHPLHAELADAREPISLYLQVRNLAQMTEPLDAVAATLSTVGVDGMPSGRVVLVKEVDQGPTSPAFVFYTNRQSRKGRELASNPFASLVFHYPSIRTQVRVRGNVALTADDRSDLYFSERPRQSQIGAWASEQSRAIEGLAQLQARFRALEQQYAGQIVPRPPHWGGYRVEPVAIEFWLEGAHRLHERVLFERKGGEWKRSHLAP